MYLLILVLHLIQWITQYYWIAYNDVTALSLFYVGWNPTYMIDCKQCHHRWHVDQRDDFVNGSAVRFSVGTILVFIHNHDLKYQHYDDDLQLICHAGLDASSVATTVHRIERCIDNTKEWMT